MTFLSCQCDELQSDPFLTVPSDVTQLLSAARNGHPLAVEELYGRVYAELRLLATQKMLRESPGHTLQPTALVHEAWLRLGGDAQPTWQDRAHFFGAAAEAMRRILVERARRKRSLRRGQGAEHIELDGLAISGPVDDEQILALDEALEQFTQVEPAKAELVKLRYFVGLTLEQAAGALNISEATAKRWWAYAKAWIFRAIRESEAGK